MARPIRRGERLERVLGQLLLLADVSAISPEDAADSVSVGSGGHGTHKERGKAPRGAFLPFHERPPVVQWVERFDRMLEAAERELETVRNGAAVRRHPSDKRSAQYRAEVASILREEGRDAVWIAFVFGWTENGVRQLRQTNGLDADTGERIKRDVLTARPA